MEYINGKVNKLVASENHLIKLKKDLGAVESCTNEYKRPNLTKQVYLAKSVTEEHAFELYEEIFEKEINIKSLSWEDSVRAELAEDEAYRKEYEKALEERRLREEAKIKEVEFEEIIEE